MSQHANEMGSVFDHSREGGLFGGIKPVRFEWNNNDIESDSYGNGQFIALNL